MQLLQPVHFFSSSATIPSFLFIKCLGRTYPHTGRIITMHTSGRENPVGHFWIFTLDYLPDFDSRSFPRLDLIPIFTSHCAGIATYTSAHIYIGSISCHLSHLLYWGYLVRRRGLPYFNQSILAEISSDAISFFPVEQYVRICPSI